MPAPRSPRLRSLLRAVTLPLALAGLAACRPEPATLTAPPPPVVVVPVADAPPPEVAAEVPAEPPVDMPPLVSVPGEVGCSWRSERWRTGVIATLKLRPGGSVFAKITGGRVHAQALIGTGDHGVMHVESGGLVLEGLVPRSQVTLYPAAAFPMSGVVYPGSNVPLAWTEGLSGAVRVTASLPPEIVATKLPVSATRPCGDVSLDRGAVVNFERAAFGRSSQHYRAVPPGFGIEVRSDPSRPADVKLTLRDHFFVEVYATRGAFSLVGGELDRFYLAGWVKTAQLQLGGGAGTRGIGSSGVGMGESARKSLRQVVCYTDVPVAAEAGGERATVGFVLAGTPIDVLREQGAFSRIYLRSPAIHVPFDSDLLARTSDLDACRSATAPPL